MYELNEKRPTADWVHAILLLTPNHILELIEDVKGNELTLFSVLNQTVSTNIKAKIANICKCRYSFAGRTTMM